MKFKLNDENSYQVEIDKYQYILIDIEDLQKLFFSEKIKSKKWKFDNNNLLYTKNSNNDPVYFLSLLFDIKLKYADWIFKNNNKNDYRKKNIEFKILNEKKVTENIKIKFPEDIEIICKFKGHIPTLGKSSGKMLNSHWLINKKNNKEDIFYMMYCEPGCFCYFSPESYNKIIKYDDGNYITWFKIQTGYIGAHFDKTIYYMHQIIMDSYDHGNKKENIDHINQNKLDNKLCNLRITIQLDQNKNQGKEKRSRNYNAIKLPDEIKNEILPKYVVYRKEVRNKETGVFREYFEIKHPKLDKQWSSSKSKDITIVEKLQQAKDKIRDIDN